MPFDVLIYYAVVGIGILLLFGLFVGWVERLVEWVDWRIHKKELEATEDEDDQSLVLDFNAAMRDQFVYGPMAGGLVACALAGIIHSGSGAWPLVVAAFVGCWLAVRNRRKDAGRRLVWWI